ncbi:serine-protein kinase ATM isoform X2 [Adelges cooleyi]|uniref:serine-protein kinase ATM isoform X2 n=1 Tax=Adelges cooleyi TaxID=133065 RepID=UPI00217F43BF|nr:serine-protein kinase ATM isoform X2 [Adelges cooleyi]
MYTNNYKMNTKSIQDLNKDLSNCLRMLDSTKITERKTTREELQNLLDCDDVINILNNSSIQKSQSSDNIDGNLTTWKSLLFGCHRCLIVEVEKENKKQSKTGETTIKIQQPNLDACSSLLKNVINKANKIRPFLRSGDLLNCITDVSRNTIYEKYTGEIYYKILEQNVLSPSYYWPILGENWNEIFNLACDIYTKKFTNISIKIMNHVILRGHNHSNITLTAKKKLFLYLKIAIQDSIQINKDYSFREDVISLTLSTFKTMGVECRISLCQFSEENAITLMHLYKTGGLKKVQKCLYKLLTKFIEIHHPKSVGIGHKASYVCNANNWTRVLLEIYEFVYQEIQLIKNYSIQNCQKYVSKLAITVFNAVYNSKLSTSHGCSAPKRQKLDINLLNFVDNMNPLKTTETKCIWLTIIIKVLGSNLVAFCENEYLNLLQYITKILNVYNKDKILTERLLKCCQAVIQAEKIMCLTASSSSQTDTFYKNVWIFAFKIIASNENLESSHSLLQALIISDHWHDELYIDTLRPYFNNTIKINDNSLKTLIVLFKKRGYSNKAFNKSNKDILLEWLLPTSVIVEPFLSWPHSKIDPELLSHIVYYMMTNIMTNKLFLNNHYLAAETKSNYLMDIYFYLKLQDIPRVMPKSIEHLEIINEKQIFDDLTCQKLTKFFKEVLLFEEDPKAIKYLEMILTHTNFVCFVENQLMQLDINPISFEPLKVKCLERLNSVFSEQEWNFNDNDNKEFVNMCSLYYERLNSVNNEILNKIKHHNSNKHIMKKLYSLTDINDSTETVKVLDYNLLTKKQVLSIEATKVMLKVCLVECRTNFDHEKSFLKNLLDIFENLDDHLFSQPCTFYKVSNFIHGVLSINNLPEQMLLQTNKLIKQLAKHWCNHQYGFIKIVQLLQGAVTRINQYSSNKVCTSNLLMIIQSIQKVSIGKKCGPTMICAFVNFLGHFAFPINGSFGTNWSTANIESLSPKSILNYLKSSFLEVRLTVIKYLYIICDAYENDSKAYKISYKEMIEIILENLQEGFIVDGNISEDEREDEYMNRISTYMLCMQALIVSSNTYRKRCLFEILHTVNSKNLSLNLVYSVFEGIETELKIKCYLDLLEDYLNYLLWEWHSKYSSLKEFPFVLFNCTTLDKFYDKYLYNIMPIFIVRNDIASLNCLNMLDDKIKEHFSVIYAHLMAIKTGDKTSIDYEKIQFFVENHLGQLLFNELIKMQFSNILLQCIKMVVTNEPTDCPMQIDKKQLLSIFDYFQITYVKNNIPFLIIMSKRQPKLIQTIVHTLYVNIYKRTSKDLRFQSFFQYTQFMKLLIDLLTKDNELNNFLSFLVYQSIQAIVVLTNQNYSEIQHFVFEYLEWLVISQQRVLLNEKNIYINQLLSCNLRNNANKPSAIGKISFKILNVLRELNGFNTNTITTTNPNNICSLHKALTDFLSKKKENIDPIHSLKLLKHKLKASEDELQLMYRELHEMRGFSEDCAQSVLHCLICSLIQYSFDADHEIKILAASCLGILGPSELTTLILQPEPEIFKPKPNTNPENSFLKHIVELLLNYLSDGNISVMEASNKSLIKIMATQERCSLYGASRLYPFNYTQTTEDVPNNFSFEEFNKNVDENNIWCPSGIVSTSFDTWITRITKALLSTFEGYCQSLLPIAEHKPIFCEQILPHLVLFILKCNIQTRAVFSKHLNNFFIKHYEIRNVMTNGCCNVAKNENNIYWNRSAVQCILNVINFVRLQQNNFLQNILDVNYLYVAQAAQFCSAYFTSILYLEIWCETENISIDRWTMSFNPVDVITEKLPKDGLLLQVILNEAYTNIGDCDAIEGCGSAHLLTLPSRTHYYQLLGKWDRVMESCDLQLCSRTVNQDYLSALTNSGLQNIAHSLTVQSDSPKYECCWQLGNWNLPDRGDSSFEALHYHAMQCIYQKNQQGVIPLINKARLAVVESLACASLESTATIYVPLVKLKMLEDLEDYIMIKDKSTLSLNWRNRTALRTNDFVHSNQILIQRSVLLDFNGDDKSGILRINIAELAREDDRLQEAGRHLATIVSLQNYQIHTTLWAKVEEARLLWLRNDCHIARVLLKYVVEELENYEYPFLNSLALQLYGSWIEETKSENISNIIKRYFEKAIKLLNFELDQQEEFGLECKKVLSDAHKRLSRYTDTLYQQVSKYIKTENLEKRLHEVEEVKEKARALINVAKSTKNNEKLKAGALLMNQSCIDESDISNTNLERMNYLKLALRNYLRLIALESEGELPIYRILSLWLENKDSPEINLMVNQGFEKSPSYMFVSILPQLVAHLSTNLEHQFHITIERLINRCAKEHPHQTIPIVYAVANSCIDQKYIEGQESVDEPRINAAKLLMSNWKHDSDISYLVTAIETLYEALINLAYTKLASSPGEKAEIPNNVALMKIKNCNALCPAVTLPLNKNGQYPIIISVVNFKNSFMNAGGIHQPKKIECICSDGKTRPLLLKGNEDMRQDAIMQQVFVLMNRLLKANKSTSQRKLTIRTYKVVPCSQQSGIAEWCTDTMSLGDYLIGRNSKPGAHQKYRPDDIPPGEARSIIQSSRKDSNFAREKKYLAVCKNFKPVFRYFFFEKFMYPSIWFERRQAYIHSVATTSMVGYILGLGDRHVQNILIDDKTAELIHIDFGIAFDQGSILNTPETVPFRLTRDIEDGMGICGIEGTFRKCCEKTMSVLRQNQEVIVTVIEVLLYDPCYQWTLTTEKAAKIQDHSIVSNLKNPDEVNKLAERSLNKVRVKLCGIEDIGSTSSVSGQVNRLIQEARDPKNLSLLFHGWQAHL